jgi:hypothetical protein
MDKIKVELKSLILLNLIFSTEWRREAAVQTQETIENNEAMWGWRCTEVSSLIVLPK